MEDKDYFILHRQDILWLLMIWRRYEPGHQQPSLPEYTGFQQGKGLSVELMLFSLT